MMKRLIMTGLVLALTACAELPQILDSGAGTGSAYSSAQLTGVVREALEISATRASEALGQSGGYNLNPQWRLTLPPAVQPIKNTLQQYGLGGPLERVENLMNQGAERAAQEAKTLFVQSIRNMSVDDAWSIIRGSNTAATDYFRTQTEAQLTARYQTLMQDQLQQVGFYTQYRQLLNSYQLLPIANKPSLDLEQYAVQRGIQALFAQVAEEEQKLRANPREQGSVLLSTLLGGR